MLVIEDDRYKRLIETDMLLKYIPTEIHTVIHCMTQIYLIMRTCPDIVSFSM